MIAPAMRPTLSRHLGVAALLLAGGAIVAHRLAADGRAITAGLVAVGAAALAALSVVRGASSRRSQDPVARRLKWMAAEVTGVQVRRYVRVPGAARPTQVHLEGKANGAPVEAQTDGVDVRKPDPRLPDAAPLQAPYRFRVEVGGLVVDTGDGTPRALVDLRDGAAPHAVDALHEACVLDQHVVLVAKTHPVADGKRTAAREWIVARAELDASLAPPSDS